MTSFEERANRARNGARQLVDHTGDEPFQTNDRRPAVAFVLTCLVVVLGVAGLVVSQQDTPNLEAADGGPAVNQATSTTIGPPTTMAIPTTVPPGLFPDCEDDSRQRTQEDSEAAPATPPDCFPTTTGCNEQSTDPGCFSDGPTETTAPGPGACDQVTTVPGCEDLTPVDTNQTTGPQTTTCFSLRYTTTTDCASPDADFSGCAYENDGNFLCTNPDTGEPCEFFADGDRNCPITGMDDESTDVTATAPPRTGTTTDCVRLPESHPCRNIEQPSESTTTGP